ncbi:MAG: cyclic nucleotide-binding domain-containing protein [Planctomycetes bacterium]|nr:cyclic nucleotide-binding domain-containing protein [Planctomycetota bacterium]
MYLTVEKVLILKSVRIFKETPEEILADVASIAEEVELQKGDIVFEEGALGKSLFVIAEGTIKVHRADHEIARLREREVFGELAALDPEPRSATVTAVDDVVLLRIDQDALYEIMIEQSEVVRGVIRVLCQRIRDAS